MKKAILLTILVINAVSADPIVVHDYGNTQPIEHFFSDESDTTIEHKDPSLFPHNTTMQPGKILNHPAKVDCQQAFFVIGNDQLSMKWLQANRLQLEEEQATGFLVQATNEQEYLGMMNLYPHYPLVLVGDHDFVESLQETNIPFKCSNNWIMQ